MIMMIVNSQKYECKFYCLNSAKFFQTGLLKPEFHKFQFAPKKLQKRKFRNYFYDLFRCWHKMKIEKFSDRKISCNGKIEFVMVQIINETIVSQSLINFFCLLNVDRNPIGM